MMKGECRGELLLTKRDRKVIFCKKCGYAHISPMYSEEELEKFYEYVYRRSTPSNLWREKVRSIKKWKSCGSILDIGCWEGAQLEYFKKEGWKCTGTELNKKAAAIATSKGISIYQISIKEFFQKFSKKRWDVVNVAYILEHIPDALGFLQRLKSNIAKNGIVMVEVPNEFNPFQLAYIKEHNLTPYWIALPDHVNYFDKEGIRNLVKKAGYTILRGESSFPMEMFLLMGDDYLKRKSLGRASFKKVVNMERILRCYEPDLLSKFYSILYQCGIGRSTVLYLQPR